MKEQAYRCDEDFNESSDALISVLQENRQIDKYQKLKAMIETLLIRLMGIKKVELLERDEHKLDLNQMERDFGVLSERYRNNVVAAYEINLNKYKSLSLALIYKQLNLMASKVDDETLTSKPLVINKWYLKDKEGSIE